MEIRKVDVPEVSGGLFLSDLPGRDNSFELDRTEIVNQGIGTVVCLASSEEVQAAAPDYFRAINSGSLSWKQVSVPMNDGDGMRNLRAVLEAIEDCVRTLRAGENVLVHCTGGIGKTGTFGIGVLIGIGLDVLEASVRVTDAEAGPESGAQEALIEQIVQARV
jgi:protein-tyrosine phosphatase